MSNRPLEGGKDTKNRKPPKQQERRRKENENAEKPFVTCQPCTPNIQAWRCRTQDPNAGMHPVSSNTPRQEKKPGGRKRRISRRFAPSLPSLVHCMETFWFVTNHLTEIYLPPLSLLSASGKRLLYSVWHPPSQLSLAPLRGVCAPVRLYCAILLNVCTYILNAISMFWI